MLYQLPDGRVINLSVEDYLSMSDQELQNLSASNLGRYATSPWDGSAIKKSNKEKKKFDIDKSIDFNEDNDEVQASITIHSTILSIITVDEINSSIFFEEDNSEELEDT